MEKKFKKMSSGDAAELEALRALLKEKDNAIAHLQNAETQKHLCFLPIPLLTQLQYLYDIFWNLVYREVEILSTTHGWEQVNNNNDGEGKTKNGSTTPEVPVSILRTQPPRKDAVYRTSSQPIKMVATSNSINGSNQESVEMTRQFSGSNPFAAADPALRSSPSQSPPRVVMLSPEARSKPRPQTQSVPTVPIATVFVNENNDTTTNESHNVPHHSPGTHQRSYNSASPPSLRRRTIDPRDLQHNLAALRLLRRSTSVNTQPEADSTLPLLQAPSTESDWGNDNPFAFLKTPAPAPPPEEQKVPVTARGTPSPPRGRSPADLDGAEVKSSSETVSVTRKRRRSHSSSTKGRSVNILNQSLKRQPTLEESASEIEIGENLSDQDARRLQVIQAYFRGRIERAKVKHMVEKQVMGRRFTMEEIILSERRYVHHLNLIITHFHRPLLRANLLNPAEITVIFVNIEHLYQLARSFLKQLEELFVEDPLVIGHRVGLLFLSMIPEWRVYSHFVNHFDSSQNMLLKCKERKSFKEWMMKAESHPALEKLGMMDYMIAAAKRIPQYELLLKAVKKCTPKSSRHYQTLRTAKTMMVELAGFLNDKKKQHDNLRKIEQIQRTLIGKIPNLSSPGRELLAEALIKEEDLILKAVFDRKVYLFNDSLLVSTAGSNKFDRLIYLSGAQMNPKITRRMVLSIGTGAEKVNFVALFANEAEKSKWISLVGHAIETLAFQEQDSILKEFAPSGVHKPRVLNSVVLKQGYLWKHRRLSGGWNKRWFVLEQGLLFYFKNPNKVQDITERATIDVGVYHLKAPIDWTQGGKMRFGFELTAPHRPAFILASEGPHERNEWIKAIQPFLLSAKTADREGMLLAVSSSSDIHKTSASRILLPAPPRKEQSEDLIKWDEPTTVASSSNPHTSRTLSSSKFYFNEDVMTRSLCGLPSHVEWHQTPQQTPQQRKKPNVLRRSLSSSDVSSST